MLLWTWSVERCWKRYIIGISRRTGIFIDERLARLKCLLVSYFLALNPQKNVHFLLASRVHSGHFTDPIQTMVSFKCLRTKVRVYNFILLRRFDRSEIGPLRWFRTCPSLDESAAVLHCGDRIGSAVGTWLWVITTCCRWAPCVNALVTDAVRHCDRTSQQHAQPQLLQSQPIRHRIHHMSAVINN